MNKSLKILLLANGVFVLAASLLGPLYAVFVAGIDRAVLAVSLTWSTALVTGVIFTFFVSFFGDRVKEKEHLLIAGYLLRALAWFGFIFASSLRELVILQIVIGMGEAVGNPAFDVIFSQHLDKNKRVFDYSNWKIMEKLMMAGGTLLGGLVVTYFGFPVLFALMSFLALGVSVFLLTQPRQVL